MTPVAATRVTADGIVVRPLSQLGIADRSSAIDGLNSVSNRKSQIENPKFRDAFLGCPSESTQAADILDDYARLCTAGWMASEALRLTSSTARPRLRAIFDEAAIHVECGFSVAEALASITSSLPPLLLPALRAWERNGQRDADLRILSRELRRLGDLQQRSTFFQIRAIMDWSARRERTQIASTATRQVEKRVGVSRAGIASRSRATMRWTDLFASLWRCNVPISEALEAAGDGCGNSYYRHMLHGAAERTRAGIPLSTCLAETRLLPIGLIDRLRTGEASGRMDEALEEFARVMEGDAKELGAQSLVMRRILPAILVTSAIIIFGFGVALGHPLIGLIAAAIYLPIAFLLWELVFRQSVAGEPNLGIGRREHKRPVPKERT